MICSIIQVEAIIKGLSRTPSGETGILAWKSRHALNAKVPCDRVSYTSWPDIPEHGMMQQHPARPGGSTFARRELTDLLSITDLHTYFFNGQPLKAVRGVNLTMGKGEVLGLVGESGSGKTMTALSVMRLVPSPGRIVEGSIKLEGVELTRLTPGEMQQVRGGRIGMIFQEPLTSLNPVLRIGDQIVETLLAHTDLSIEKAKERSTGLLRKVGFDSPEKRMDQYPHQLSGGQRQRVLIAIAISCNPSLVIADEPTTALDVTIERQIMALLQALTRELSISLLFITHNLRIIERIGNRIAIMYAGEVVETSSTAAFFAGPLHPYSQGLLTSMPVFSRDCARLAAIPGAVPRLSDLPKGCKFNPRCPHVMAICRQEEPPMFNRGNGRWVRCFLYQG